MSVDHHGIPDRPTLRPARTWVARDSNVAGISPDHKKAPHCWLPAQAERIKVTTSLLAGGVHAVVNGAGVVGRVAVEYFPSWPNGKAEVVDVAWLELRLAGIQPEQS